MATPLVLTLFGMTAAQALPDDTLTLRAGYSLLTDSNLFRLPAGANATALIGRSSAAERIGVASAGLKLDWSYSLQRIELDLDLVDYRYHNFSYLSYQASNYNAAWRWALTPRLRGNLSTERRETLNSFADFQGFNQRNLRTTTNTRLDGIYQLTGAWRVLGGVSRSGLVNQQLLVAEGDTRSTGAELGLGYALASGSSLTYTFKSIDGHYLKRVLPSVGLFDDRFDQTESQLALRWVVSGKTSVDLQASRLSRKHPNYPQRDYDDPTARAELNWSMSAKTLLSASWARELASFQTATSSYTQTDRISIGPTWQFSPKTSIQLRYDLAQRKHLGSPAVLLGPARTDSERDLVLSTRWQPHDLVTFSASLQRSRRSSNLPGFDYNSNGATFSAQFAF